MIFLVNFNSGVLFNLFHLFNLFNLSIYSICVFNLFNSFNFIHIIQFIPILAIMERIHLRSCLIKIKLKHLFKRKSNVFIYCQQWRQLTFFFLVFGLTYHCIAVVSEAVSYHHLVF